MRRSLNEPVVATVLNPLTWVALIAPTLRMVVFPSPSTVVPSTLTELTPSLSTPSAKPAGMSAISVHDMPSFMLAGTVGSTSAVKKPRAARSIPFPLAIDRVVPLRASVWESETERAIQPEFSQK